MKLSQTSTKNLNLNDMEVTSTAQFFENQALLNYKQAASYLGICESYLRRLKRKGQIAYVQIGLRGIRFSFTTLNLWIKEREVT